MFLLTLGFKYPKVNPGNYIPIPNGKEVPIENYIPIPNGKSIPINAGILNNLTYSKVNHGKSIPINLGILNTPKVNQGNYIPINIGILNDLTYSKVKSIMLNWQCNFRSRRDRIMSASVAA
jgi:hypothetical protein